MQVLNWKRWLNQAIRIRFVFDRNVWLHIQCSRQQCKINKQQQKKRNNKINKIMFWLRIDK